jgi:hypothetical protein
VNEQHRGLWSQAVTRIAGENVIRFWSRHAWVLLGLGVLLLAALACRDIWDCFPRWPVYFFTTALVLDALLHPRINRAYESGQLQAWHDLLALAESVEANARSGAGRPPQQSQVTKPPTRPGPPLRVFRPDEEPSRNSS